MRLQRSPERGLSFHRSAAIYHNRATFSEMQCNPLKPALLLATSLGALHAINLHFHRPSLPTKILPDSVASKPDYSVNAHGAPASRPRASAPPAVPSTASKALGDTAGHTQSAEEAATPFSCANVSVRGLLYDLSALKADWRIASKDSDVEMLVNPCGPLKYENKHCLAGHTGLCLLEKTGGNGVASFGLVSKVLVSPKGTIWRLPRQDELMLTYTSDLFSKDGLPLQGIVKLICDRNASKVERHDITILLLRLRVRVTW